jgi:hypothetical protein
MLAATFSHVLTSRYRKSTINDNTAAENRQDRLYHGDDHRNSRMTVSDITLKRPLPPELSGDLMACVGGIAGAISVEDYQRGLLDSGFAEVQVVDSGTDLNAYAQDGFAGRKYSGAAEIGDAPELLCGRHAGRHDPGGVRHATGPVQSAGIGQLVAEMALLALWALLISVGLTLVASYFPAHRAARLDPCATFQEI